MKHLCALRNRLFFLSRTICLILICVQAAIHAAGQAICSLNPQNDTVTICTPANNATVSMTFRVNAGVTDNVPIRYMQVYVNHKLYATQFHNFIDATITVPAGANQPLTVQARDKNNLFIKTHYTLQISGSGPSPLTVSPSNPSLSEGASQLFTANAPATFTASCGMMMSSGQYTAPLAPGACTITATATDGSNRTGTATATITSPITITPASANTPVNQQQQFTANVAVNWTATCGSISNTGLFTAPATQGVCTIMATASSGPAYTAQAIDTVGAPQPLTISPMNPALVENASLTFIASAPANFSASCGAISSGGQYTAPLVPGSCTVTATASDGSGRTASTTATITSPITITPPSATTVEQMTQQFSASAAVNWTASCGAITGGGLFTAPGMPGTCTITATASTGTAFTAQAVDTVIPLNAPGLNYTTWKNDSMRTGLQGNETVLTKATVNSNHLAPIFSVNVDDGVWAQPLYVGGLRVKGASHNVVFAETMNDSAYAFDADTGTQLWHATFLSNGVTPAVGKPIGSTIQSNIGVTGTPVIDISTNTIYMVAETLENSGTTYVHRLHALDITNGHEKLGGPVVIAASGFQSKEQLQRPALLLANGNVYIAFGSQGDTPPYHGWIFAYDAGTLGKIAVWNDTPNGNAGGIWMGGSGSASDPSGDIYVSIGNGSWDGTAMFGQSVVRLSPGLVVVDYFTPFDHVKQTQGDVDLGSGGVLVVPDQNGNFPHELIACGKMRKIYVIDRDNMGHIGTTSDHIIQHVDNAIGGTSGRQAADACFTTGAFWNQNVYFVGNNDVLKQFTLNPNSGLLSTSAVSQDTHDYGFLGAQAVVSANGNSNGITWAIDHNAGTLRANDATNVSKVLYVSPKLGSGIKYSVPTVINGHVYVGLNKKLVGFATH